MIRENAAYARQSVEKKNSLSISGQLALCKKAAGTETLREYKDTGYSGKNTERPSFKRLIKDICADRIGTLYVYRLDRFSRSVADFGQLWEVLKAHDVEFVSVSENFDTNTPMGRAMLHIIMVFAQLERETTAERVRDNYYRRAALGQWPGGPAPYGFDIGKITDSGRAVPTLVPNNKSETINKIFSHYASEQVSLGSLSRALNKSGVPGINRDTWDNVMLSRVLHNPVYVCADEEVRRYFLAQGVSVTSDAVAFDGSHGVLLVGKRRSGSKDSANDYTASVLNSPGIVSPELWIACQEKLSKNAKIGNSGRGKHTWLSGLLKCAECGYSVKIAKNRDIRRTLCSGRYNLAKCSAEIHTDLDALEASISCEISKLFLKYPAKINEIIEPARIAEIDRRIERLVDAFTESDMDKSYLSRAIGKLELEKQEIIASEQKKKAEQIKNQKIDFSLLSFEKKKAVAALVIEKINLSGEGAEIIWKI